MNAFESDPRKRRIAASFGARAADYERHARMQQHVAAHLARMLPSLRAPAVLEIGCGTGFLTRHLLDAYPDGDLLVTDIAPAMLDACASSVGNRPGVRFAVLDGEAPPSDRRFDLIATSMTLQWFADPLASLTRLSHCLTPDGSLVYATIGPDLFPQWRAVLADLSLPCGLIDVPDLPGILERRGEDMQFAGGLDFLMSLKAIGAAEPRPGYQPIAAGHLRRALREWERRSGGTASWNIVYGRMNSFNSEF